MNEIETVLQEAKKQKHDIDKVVHLLLRLGYTVDALDEESVSIGEQKFFYDESGNIVACGR